MTTVFDLSGIFQLYNSGLDPKLSDNIKTTYENVISTGKQTIENQQIIKSIVDSEYARLQDLSNNINDEYFFKKRQIFLNENYQKKQKYYLYVLLSFILSLILYIMLVKIQQFFPIIPKSIIYFIAIIMFSIFGIYIILLLTEINRRDHIYFDEVKYSPPNIAKTTTDKNKEIEKSGTLLSSLSNKCVGDSCCSDGTVWDETLNKCKISSVSPFSTMEGYEGYSFFR